MKNIYKFESMYKHYAVYINENKHTLKIVVGYQDEIHNEMDYDYILKNFEIIL